MPIPIRMMREPHSRKSVNGDDVDMVKHPVVAHQVKPVMVDGNDSAKHRVTPPTSSPGGGVPNHGGELPPVRIETHEVPLVAVVWLVPQFQVLPAIAIIGDDAVDEVG